MRYIIRNYFSFNKREKRAVLLLVFLNLLLLFYFSIESRVFPRSEKPFADPLTRPFIQKPSVTLQHQDEKLFRKLSRGNRSRSFISPKPELNSCDSAALEKLKGIGPAFARRIVIYRNKLGGFYSLKQLMEVYGMDSARFDLLSSQITIDTMKIRAFDLNQVSSEELSLHPYIRFNLAALIVNYRQKHGKYTAIEDLKKLHLVNAELYSKIAPYFRVL